MNRDCKIFMSGTSRSGRRRKPAALRNLQGSKTRSHHTGEPQYAKESALTMPEMIAKDDIASAKWERLVLLMTKSGVLTEAHIEMLTLLCMSWADLERCREQFRMMNYTPVIVETNGDQRRIRNNPLVSRMEKLAYQVARFLGEFGLTPMTSAKVSGERAVEGIDPFAEFLEDDGHIYNTQRTQ